MQAKDRSGAFRFRSRSSAAAEKSAASTTIDPVALYAEFTPLVNKLIRQYGACPQLRDDLVGEIFCRFCALVEAYDPSRGVPLRPYLVHQLQASVYTYVRSYRRPATRELSIEPHVNQIQIRSEMNCNPTHDWNHALFMESAREAMHRSMHNLSDRQKQVVTRRYLHDDSFENIAVDLGVQAATARSLLRHALSNLRGSLTAEQMLLD